MDHQDPKVDLKQVERFFDISNIVRGFVSRTRKSVHEESKEERTEKILVSWISCDAFSAFN